jgi:hypothetical protein
MTVDVGCIKTGGQSEIYLWGFHVLALISPKKYKVVYVRTVERDTLGYPWA